jgi:hypothetical protein
MLDQFLEGLYGFVQNVGREADELGLDLDFSSTAMKPKFSTGSKVLGKVVSAYLFLFLVWYVLLRLLPANFHTAYDHWLGFR